MQNRLLNVEQHCFDTQLFVMESEYLEMCLEEHDSVVLTDDSLLLIFTLSTSIL